MLPAVGLLSAIVVLNPASLRADERVEPTLSRVVASEESKSEAPRPAPAHAAVVLVARESATELLALIGELLEREAISCDVSRSVSFDRDELFANADSDATVRVFVRIEAGGPARMYFRAPGGERFLIRKIALSNGLDAVGRELVAQVVASSVVALLRSPVGLSRQQASVEVARDASPPSGADSAQSPQQTRPVKLATDAARELPSRAHDEPPMMAADRPRPGQSRAVKPSSPSAASLELLLTLFYGISYAGPDVYLANGPGLEVGLGLRRTFLLRARMSAQHLFQKLRTQELTAHADTNALRASIDVGVPLGGNAGAFVALGGGVDLVEVNPGAPHASDVQPADAHGALVPVLRTEFRYEAVKRPVILGVATFADLPLLDTHYDLEDRGARQRLAVPWKVRPGAALTFGFQW